MEPGSSENNLHQKSIFISAGEQSGEMHGAALIKELRKIEPDLNVNSLGGDLMHTEGANLLYHINTLAAVGLVDVAKKYGFFKKVLAQCLEFVKKSKPGAVILIDYPGFNLRFASELRKFYSGKIIYYISPQIWAWHESRVKKIKKCVDTMLVVFPFEVNFYAKYDIEALYVGHPLVKRIGEFLINNNAGQYKFRDTKLVTLLPGSRKNEIKNHLPVLLKAARKLKDEFNLRVKVSRAMSIDEETFEPYSNEMNGFELTTENPYELMLNSDLVMAKAGTSTLECALIGVPHFVFLRTSKINYALLKPIVKIENIGIVNIITGKEIVKEFIQKDFTPENIYDESKKILTDDSYRNNLLKKMHIIKDILGEGDASFNAARIIKEIALS